MGSACPSGFSSNVGEVCVPCLPGEVSSPGGRCTPCPPGFGNIDRVNAPDVCGPCPDGSSSILGGACVLNVHKDSFLRMANSASPVSKEQSQPVWGLASVRLVPLDLLQTLEELHVSPAKLDFLPPLAGLVLPVKGVRRPEVEVLVNPVPLEMETRQLSQDPVYPVHWATAL